MVFRRHERHEIFFDDIFVIADRRFHIRVNDALFDEAFLNGMVNDFGIVLRADTGEGFFLFGFRDAETVKRVFDVFRHFFPVARHLGVRLDIRDDVVHVEVVEARSPRRQCH